MFSSSELIANFVPTKVTAKVLIRSAANSEKKMRY